MGGAACHAGSLDERAAPSSSQDALLIQPVVAKSKQNSRNGKRSSSQQQTDNINNVKKWKCHQCTYENWPRAVKCIMCQSPRRRTPSPPLSGGEERDTTQFPPASATTTPQQQQQQVMSRLASSLTTTTTSSTRSPSSLSSSSSPIHSRSSSNSNETLAMSQHLRFPMAVQRQLVAYMALEEEGVAVMVGAMVVAGSLVPMRERAGAAWR